MDFHEIDHPAIQLLGQPVYGNPQMGMGQHLLLPYDWGNQHPWTSYDLGHLGYPGFDPEPYTQKQAKISKCLIISTQNHRVSLKFISTTSSKFCSVVVWYIGYMANGYSLLVVRVGSRRNTKKRKSASWARTHLSLRPWLLIWWNLSPWCGAWCNQISTFESLCYPWVLYISLA